MTGIAQLGCFSTELHGHPPLHLNPVLGLPDLPTSTSVLLCSPLLQTSFVQKSAAFSLFSSLKIRSRIFYSRSFIGIDKVIWQEMMHSLWYAQF